MSPDVAMSIAIVVASVIAFAVRAVVLVRRRGLCSAWFWHSGAPFAVEHAHTGNGPRPKLSIQYRCAHCGDVVTVAIGSAS